MDPIYSVSSFPTTPYPGVKYFNVNTLTLGIYNEGDWEYFNPYTLALPADSFSQLPSGDAAVDVSYPGSGVYGTSVIDPSFYLSGIETGYINNSTDPYTIFSGQDNLIIRADNSLFLSKKGIKITVEPGDTLFYGSFVDINNNSLPDMVDSDAEYRLPITSYYNESDLSSNPAIYLKVGDSISVLLEGADPFNIYDSFGNLVFTETGLAETYTFNSVGQYIYGTGGIINISYAFNSSGIDPSSFLDNINSGSVNNSATEYTTVLNKDALVIDANNTTTTYNSLTNITVSAGATLFYGDLKI